MMINMAATTRGRMGYEVAELRDLPYGCAAPRGISIIQCSKKTLEIEFRAGLKMENILSTWSSHRPGLHVYTGMCYTNVFVCVSTW